MAKQNKKFQVVTVGGTTRDIMFYSKEGEIIKTPDMTKQKMLAFEYGAKIMADELHFSFGGGASNAAVAMASLGLKPAIVCMVGNDDNGNAVLKNFKERGVDISKIKISKDKATGFSVILTVDNKAREHVIFLHRGVNDSLTSSNLAGVESDWFYVSSLPKNDWTKIMTALVNKNSNIFWNPGEKQLKDLAEVKKFLPKIKVFSINRDEALEFRKLKDIKGLIKYIQSLGPKIVVITDGANGAYAYDGSKYYFMKAKSTKAVDTVGVGDAFGSAFASALIYGKTVKDALSWGIKNSASCVAKIGAQNGLLTKKQIER